MKDPLETLSDLGVSIWLDDISRQRLASGNLAQLVTDKHVVGVTTNPTIFAKAVAEADALRRAGQRPRRSRGRPGGGGPSHHDVRRAVGL